MSTHTDSQALQATQSRVLALLGDLPPESLTTVEQFVRFLREQARRKRPVLTTPAEEPPPFRYPTVAVPASSLDRWLNLIPEGYEGDALADTEALYDEA